MINIGKLSKQGKDVILKEVDNGCLECVSHCKDDFGYSRIFINGKHKRLFRVLYELEFGKIDNNLVVRHICDNPSCCNIKHLEIGTQSDNVNDMVKRNRSVKGRNNLNFRGMKNPQSKLTDDVVISIFISNDSYTKLAKKYGVSKITIRNIKKQICWKWLTDNVAR